VWSPETADLGEGFRGAERELGRMLVERRLITADAMERCALEAERSGSSLTRVLIETGRVAAADVLDAVAEHLRLPRCRIDGGFLPDPALVGRLTGELAERLQALPYGREGDGTILVAVADPLDEAKRRELGVALGNDVRLALAERGPLTEAIAHTYGTATGPAGAEPAPTLQVNDLLEVLLEMGGSDLHLTAGTVPQVRVDGELVPLERFGRLAPAPLRSMIYGILTNRQRRVLEDERELDCSHPLPGKGRFRVSVFFQRDSIGAVMRAIPNTIAPLEELGMPPAVGELTRLTRGLVLVTGPAGSGKSTTLASLIDRINTTRAAHIMTVEDPIEFMHRHRRSIVNQREVGADTLSFASALKHALRQDPDVILVGEMRDLETIATAITAAETGHLVLATLHTMNAAQSVERIIDVFPAHQQQQVRIQLAGTLQAVVAQQLLPRRHREGRVAAVEFMRTTPAIRNLIRSGKIHQIPTAMQAGGKLGMQTMDQALARLVKAGEVEYAAAHERCHDAGAFTSLVDERLRV